MNGALLSILAQYHYDNTIFDNLVVPSGVDKDNLIENLRLELAEFEVLYSEPELMKLAIKSWSHKELPVWQKLYDTTLLEYNPIENYDRKEDWQDSSEGTSSAQTQSTGEQHGAGHDNGTGENTLTVAGFNTNDLTNREKNNHSAENNSTTDMAHTDEASSTADSTNESSHTGRVHGNIGVTTTQQMIEAERNIVQFTVIDFIINSFKNRFCILVY